MRLKEGAMMAHGGDGCLPDVKKIILLDICSWSSKKNNNSLETNQSD